MRDETKAKIKKDRDEGREWREQVLTEIVSLSISSSLNRLGTIGKATGDDQSPLKMPTSSSKPRLGIPEELLSSARDGDKVDVVDDFGQRMRTLCVEDEPGTLAGIGQAMLESGQPLSVYSIFNGGNHEMSGMGPLGQPRVLAQIGKEDSMASASV